MRDGSTLYLVREDSTQMAGVCFVDNNRAIVERISFFADSTGAATFVFGNDTCSYKISVNQLLKEIELLLPQCPTWGIDSQTVRLSYFGDVPPKVDFPERYKNQIFTNITSQKEIQYGAALGYYTSKPTDYISKDDYKKWFSEMLSVSRQNNGFLFSRNMEQLPLLLDIYHPQNDILKKRPLLLFVHGGAFFFGDKENKLQQIITDYMVKRGFVLASINYRLGTSITPGAIERTIFRGVQDVRAALRYLGHHKERFRIDEEQIYLIGSSAGGIISLTTAFMDSDEVYSSTGRGLFRVREDLGGLDDSGNDLKERFTIAGVASMWGGVTNLDMLNNNIPTLLFHGTADDIVPCDEGLPFKDFMGNFVHRVLSSLGKIYGSAPIYARLKSQDVPVRYIPFEDAGHDPYIESDNSVNEIMDVICHELADFLFERVSEHYFNHPLLGNTVVGENDFATVYQLDNIENTIVHWQVEGGFITRQSNDSIRVIWYDSYDAGLVTAWITNENGITCKKEMEVVIN